MSKDFHGSLCQLTQEHIGLQLVGGLRPEKNWGSRPEIRFADNIFTELMDGQKQSFKQPFGCLMIEDR